MAKAHPALQRGQVAVITGGASGIGLAVACALHRQGMRLCLVDADAAALEAAARELPEASCAQVDVADRGAMTALAQRTAAELGPVSFLMNNAAVGAGGDALSNPDAWDRLLGVNLMGVVNGVQAFVPAMAASGEPGLVVNTGSKQGITTPPGNTAYNVSKAGVKALTEGLAHTLRTTPDCRVTAHLLIPGFTYTGMMTRHFPEKPPAAWTPDQVAERLFAGIAEDEFYILCPDNETPRAIDEKRIVWAAMDIVSNRPALSRWHPEWKERFDAFMASPEPPAS